MAIAYEVWCTVGRHEPSLLALLAYQDSPHISANEMLRQKLKTVLLTAVLTGAFPLSSHPLAPRRHTTCDSKGSINSTRQDDRNGSAVARGYGTWPRHVWSRYASSSADLDSLQRLEEILGSGSGSPCEVKGSWRRARRTAPSSVPVAHAHPPTPRLGRAPPRGALAICGAPDACL